MSAHPSPVPTPPAGDYFPPTAADWIYFAIEALFYILVALKLLRELRKLCRQGLFTWLKMVGP